MFPAPSSQGTNNPCSCSCVRPAGGRRDAGWGPPPPQGTPPACPKGSVLGRSRKKVKQDPGASPHHFRDRIKYSPEDFSTGPPPALKAALSPPWQHAHSLGCRGALLPSPCPSSAHTDGLGAPCPAPTPNPGQAWASRVWAGPGGGTSVPFSHLASTRCPPRQKAGAPGGGPMTWPPRCVRKRLPDFPYTEPAGGTEVSGRVPAAHTWMAPEGPGLTAAAGLW